MSKVNYVFVRHGQGCHNVANSFYKESIIGERPIQVDPELTDVGVDASIQNGCHISKVLKNNFNINTINIVGCSPLLRCMETAYYMTRKWVNPPRKIFVFPHLREIDESYKTNKYSMSSYEIMEKVPSYAMKTIAEQKFYLLSKGILQFFDFTYVERFSKERKLPGDLASFMTWFSRHFVPSIKSKQNLNVFITTHHGVLRDAIGESFTNNNGVLIQTIESETILKMYSLTNLLPKGFFKNYNSIMDKAFYCPSSRCSKLCTNNQVPKNNQIGPVKVEMEKCDVEI